MKYYMSITEVAQEINFQASNRDEQLSDRNLDVLKRYYEQMFNSLCGHTPQFRLIDNKGRIEIYGL